jgi:hypothetical protein
MWHFHFTCQWNHQIGLGKSFYLPPCIVRVLQRSLKRIFDDFIYISSRYIQYNAYELCKHVTYFLFVICLWGHLIGPPVPVVCNCADSARHLVQRGRKWFYWSLFKTHCHWKLFGSGSRNSYIDLSRQRNQLNALTCWRSARLDAGSFGCLHVCKPVTDRELSSLVHCSVPIPSVEMFAVNVSYASHLTSVFVPAALEWQIAYYLTCSTVRKMREKKMRFMPEVPILYFNRRSNYRHTSALYLSSQIRFGFQGNVFSTRTDV